MKIQNSLIISSIMILCIVSLISNVVVAQESISFTLDRNFGMGFGTTIQGTFTLRATGHESIENLTVYFNDIEVYFVESNSIVWQFQTGNYASGSTNITLLGIADDGTTYIGSQVYNFLGDSISGFITVVIVVIVILLIILKYGPMLKRRKSQMSA